VRYVSAHEAEQLIASADPLAVLDIREHGLYGEGHLLFASNCPYSVLELKISALVPDIKATLIIYDDADGVAKQAAQALEHVGYKDVLIIEGGIDAWRSAGHAVFKGVNVPSKVLGELIEHAMEVKSVTPDELARMQASGQALLLIDGRPTSEFEKMTIPGARSLPNGELLYRWDALDLDPAVPVVVHCAGRTRGLIGAQSLINAGIPNPVVALQNGTQGWALSGRHLTRGNRSDGLPAMTSSKVDQGGERFERLVTQHGIQTLEASDFTAWRHVNANAYMFDVRSKAEFEAANVPGSLHAPTVQLVQATDEYVAQRRSPILLIDDNGVRAASAAVWLKQLGHKPIVMRRAEALMTQPDALRSPRSRLRPVSPSDVALCSDTNLILDLRKSMAFREGHVPGSIWATRARLASVVPLACRTVTFVADDPRVADLCASDLETASNVDCFILDGGFQAWCAQGGEVEQTPDRPADAEAIDFLFFVHDRHNGNLEASRRYLEWETGLVAQMSSSERGQFHIEEKRHG
jgi:rhodanese-related sulfurtransferase